jgi:predicted transcriptional regulator
VTRRRKTHLDRLARIADQDYDSGRKRYAAIVAARADGFTLQEIADVLGVTRQAVHQLISRWENRAGD